jgi:hypothetical protein
MQCKKVAPWGNPLTNVSEIIHYPLANSSKILQYISVSNFPADISNSLKLSSWSAMFSRKGSMPQRPKVWSYLNHKSCAGTFFWWICQILNVFAKFALFHRLTLKENAFTGPGVHPRLLQKPALLKKHVLASCRKSTGSKTALLKGSSILMDVGKISEGLPTTSTL